jgi:hypothetical protein
MSERNCHDSGARQAASEYRRIKGKKDEASGRTEGTASSGGRKKKKKKEEKQ